jgi:Flp pilus assembly pilin Flp
MSLRRRLVDATDGQSLIEYAVLCTLITVVFGSAVEALVDRALFVGAIEFASPISGDEAFVEQFASRALRESEGRSLRDLDLSQRLFRYPLSFVVDTPAFAALPAVAKEAVYARLATILASPVSDTESDPFAHLSARDRNAVREILAATTPEFAAVAR